MLSSYSSRVQIGGTHVESPAAAHSSALRFAAQVAGASIFVALCAHIAVPLPFTPVPFTLQPFAVLLVGMLLGPATGFAALALYLCEGAAGLPVFTPVGLPGIARLLGPTAGYLFAYPVAAALAGGLPRLLAGRQRFVSFALAGIIAMLTVYACASLWFSYVLRVPFGTALSGSVLPFAPFDAIKVCAAAAMAASIARPRNHA